MNESQVKRSSLFQLIQEIAPLLDCSNSIDRALCTVENFELHIQNLEARIESIQQEIDVLIAEQ